MTENLKKLRNFNNHHRYGFRISSLTLLFSIFLLSIFISSCVSPSLMLKTPKDFNFAALDSLQTDSDYVIAVNDKIRMQIYSANGLSYLDNLIATTNGQNTNSATNNLNSGAEYLIEYDSTIKLPIFKNIKLAGLKIREAERYLESLYAQYYENPFVILTVTN